MNHNLASSEAKSRFMSKLRSTKRAEVESGELATLSEAETDAVSGGAIRVIIVIRTRTDSCSGGVADDCLD
jgi:hypothetical protein